MSLTAYYQNLRQAPETKRRRVAFVSSLALTALIAVGWLINMGVLFAPTQEYSGQAQVANVTENEVSILNNLAERLSKGWKTLTDLF